MENDFAVFILTYGRPDKVITIKTLRDGGYTGEIFLVCSTDDKSLSIYKNNYPDQVLTFSKDDYKGTFDIGDNFDDDRVVIYARNAVFDLAEQVGKEYFLVLDDDYTNFNYRFDQEFDYNTQTIRNLDKVFRLTLEYYKSINALSIAYAQGGDFIGGKEGSMAERIHIKRKIMNSFFCSTKRRFKFIGRLNEDVNTYITLGQKGKLAFQTNQVALEQLQTQSNSGGLTEAYLAAGTYIKSFYSIIYSPSSVKISLMGNKDRRIHHFITWNNTVSKIIEEKYKKLS